MSTKKMFPIQSQRGAAPHPLSISWETAELAYSVYASMYGRGQSLECLAERGGFGPMEMDEFLPGWRERESKLARYEAALERLARLGNGDSYGNSEGNDIAQIALFGSVKRSQVI